MSVKSATQMSQDEAEAELALIISYIREKQKDGFFGLIELSFHGGEFKNAREIRARPAGSLAADLWSQIPDKTKAALEKKYKNHTAFSVGST